MFFDIVNLMRSGVSVRSDEKRDRRTNFAFSERRDVGYRRIYDVEMGLRAL